MYFKMMESLIQIFKKKQTKKNPEQICHFTPPTFTYITSVRAPGTLQGSTQDHIVANPGLVWGVGDGGGE